MGNLILTRREGEEIHLSIAPGADPAQLLEALARDGITILVGETSGGQTKIGLRAPAEINIARAELLADDF